jgi:hypothetical protein
LRRSPVPTAPRVPDAERTVVLYAHYDGQPVDPSEWASPPWTPTLQGDRRPDDDLQDAPRNLLEDDVDVGDGIAGMEADRRSEEAGEDGHEAEVKETLGSGFHGCSLGGWPSPAPLVPSAPS